MLKLIMKKTVSIISLATVIVFQTTITMNKSTHDHYDIQKSQNDALLFKNNPDYVDPAKLSSEEKDGYIEGFYGLPPELQQHIINVGKLTLDPEIKKRIYNELHTEYTFNFDGRINKVVLSKNGLFLAIETESSKTSHAKVIVFNTKKNHPIISQEQAAFIAFSPNCKYAITKFIDDKDDTHITLWDMEREQLCDTPSLPWHDINPVFNNKTSEIIYFDNNSIYTLNLITQKKVQIIEFADCDLNEYDAITELTLSPKGSYCLVRISGENNKRFLLNAKTGDIVSTFYDNNDSSTIFDNDEKNIIWYHLANNHMENLFNKAYVFSIETKNTHFFDYISNPTHKALSITPDSSYLVNLSGSRSIVVFDLKNKNLAHQINTSSDILSYYITSRFIICLRNNQISIYSIETGKHLRNILLIDSYGGFYNPGEYFNFNISPDSTHVSINTGSHYHVWDIHTGTKILEIDTDTIECNSSHFNALLTNDYQHLYLIAQNKIILWSTKSLEKNLNLKQFNLLNALGEVLKERKRLHNKNVYAYLTKKQMKTFSLLPGKIGKIFKYLIIAPTKTSLTIFPNISLKNSPKKTIKEYDNRKRKADKKLYDSPEHKKIIPSYDLYTQERSVGRKSKQLQSLIFPLKKLSLKSHSCSSLPFSKL